MKVFVCDSDKKFFDQQTGEYNWTEPGEILFLGLFRYDHHKGLTGIQTTKSTTHIVVKDLNVDTGFMLELIRQSYIAGKHNVTDDDKVSLDMGFGEDIILDYKNNLEMTLKEAEKFEVNDKIKVQGFNFTKI